MRVRPWSLDPALRDGITAQESGFRNRLPSSVNALLAPPTRTRRQWLHDDGAKELPLSRSRIVGTNAECKGIICDYLRCAGSSRPLFYRALSDAPCRTRAPLASPRSPRSETCFRALELAARAGTRPLAECGAPLRQRLARPASVTCRARVWTPRRSRVAHANTSTQRTPRARPRAPPGTGNTVTPPGAPPKRRTGTQYLLQGPEPACVQPGSSMIGYCTVTIPPSGFGKLNP
jgi:hypothetical protein